MNRIKTSVVIGCVCLLATIAVFSLAHPILLPSRIVGFVFVLYAEFVFFGGFIFVESLVKKTSGILSRAGVGITIAGYSIIVFITSLMYMIYGTLFVRWFVIVQILLFVVAFAIVAVMISFAKTAELSDLRTLQADAMINNFQSNLSLISERVENKTDICKLMDAIRFSDSSVMVDCDVEIDEAISRLNKLVENRQDGSEEYKKQLDEIEFLIKKRNLQAKNMKQGGI